MPNTDELLDVVSDTDEVIGQMYRSAVYSNGLTNFRAVNAFVQNDRGELWIPRRTAHKRIFPLCLDASVSGHVESGETYEQALEREAQEELGIDVSVVGYRECGKLTPSEHGVSAFMKVFVLQKNSVAHYNRQDFTEAFWLLPEDLLGRITQGDPCKSDLPKMIKHIFFCGRF